VAVGVVAKSLDGFVESSVTRLFLKIGVQNRCTISRILDSISYTQVSCGTKRHISFDYIHRSLFAMSQPLLDINSDYGAFRQSILFSQARR